MKSDDRKLKNARRRRQQLKSEGLCINGRQHALPVHGVRCDRCRVTHGGKP